MNQRLVGSLSVLLVLIGIAPVLSLLLALTAAEVFDCNLNEAIVTECIVWGADRGRLLTQMTVVGWLSILTLPLAVFGLLLGLVYLVRRRRDRAGPLR